MEIRGKEINGLPAVQVRDALRAFDDLETPMMFENGTFKIEKKTLKAEFLAEQLGLSPQYAASLLTHLISEGYIDAVKLTPTHLGMALISAEDRDRLPLDKAHEVLESFIEAVKTVNAKPGARILIDRVYVFGSYAASAETVGDIDLLILSPLPEDCEPEDMDERDAVFEELNVSEYLSFHDELDPVALEADRTLVYERNKSS